jgi:hypothetical protein
MSTLHLVAGFGALGFATLVAVANWIGCIASSRQQKAGASGRFSTIPILCLAGCLVAWYLLKDKIGFWSFAPAAVDLGTLGLIALPVLLLVEALRKK